MMRFCVIVDGTNFINRLLDMGRDNSFIINELSFPKIAECIQQLLRENGLPALYNGTDFYCSNKKISNLTKDETEQFLNKLRYERGVTVEQVGIITDGKEKALDTSIIIFKEYPAACCGDGQETVLRKAAYSACND